MDERAFARLFPGEGVLIEFKEGVSTRKVQEAAVAFSNTDGGVILVGVRATGSILGVSQVGEAERKLHEALRGITNCGRYVLRQLAVGPSTVLVVSIERRGEGFAQTPDGVVRSRMGASNPPLRGAELSRFLAARSFDSFESTATTFTLENVRPENIEPFRAAYGWPSDVDLTARLEELGHLVNVDGTERLTVAGALLLLDDPTTIGCRAFVDMRRFSPDTVEPDKTWAVTGTVAAQIERATADIVAELGSTTAVLGTRRVDMPKLPPRALREAVANAVAHRSYQDAGSAIRIEIHRDRVKITSPGGLPEPVTVENIRDQQAARNDRILGALRRLGLAEDLGRGIDRMEDDMAADLHAPPEYADDGAFFSVELRLVGAVTPVERAWVKGLVDEQRVDARSAPVVVHAARSGTVTNADVRNMLGIDSVDARSILRRLVAAGVFELRGKRGGARYVLAPRAATPTRIRHSAEELEQIVLALARDEPVTNARVREHTGCDRLEALSLLRRLVARGELRMLGTRRGSRYVPVMSPP